MKNRFTEEQIISVLKEAETGVKVAENFPYHKVKLRNGRSEELDMS
ncbi:hypothetical protein [Undibacterium sp. WLHG33]